jgi:hypothetical protein
VFVVPAGASTPVTSTAPAAAAGGIGIRLVAVAATKDVDPQARIYIVDRVAPGAVIERRIQVSNSTSSTAHIVLYAAAATIEKGAFVGAAGHTQDALSTWTSIAPSSSDVGSGGLLTATVSISVPLDAAPGVHDAVVWAEMRSGGADSGVVQISRVGVRMYVSIGPGGVPAANFSIGPLAADRSSGGRLMVMATVHNTGGWPLGLSGALELRGGPGGLSAGPLPVTVAGTLAIGDSEPVSVVLDSRIPVGLWRADMTLESGSITRRADASITLPGATTEPGRGATAIGGLVLVALSAVAAVVVVRRRRRQARSRVTVPKDRASR